MQLARFPSDLNSTATVFARNEKFRPFGVTQRAGDINSLAARALAVR
jgi:hypothetical protein